LVLLILGAVWAAVLIPPALRARAEASPGDSIGHFHQQLNVLRRTGGYAPVPGRPASPAAGLAPPASVLPTWSPESMAKKRRRDILVTLLGIMGTSLLLGLLPAFRGLLVLHLVADVLCAGYVMLLLRFKRAAEIERARKVTRLRRETPPGVADLALRRAAAGR